MRRVVLLLNAASFLFFAVKWLLNPSAMAGPLGIVLTNADAITDAQAVYGGLELGVALFLAYCAFRPGHTQVGLVAATLTLAGLGLCRLAGVVTVSGAITGATKQLLTTDLFGATLNAVFCFSGARSLPTDGGTKKTP